METRRKGTPAEALEGQDGPHGKDGGPLTGTEALGDGEASGVTEGPAETSWDDEAAVGPPDDGAAETGGWGAAGSAGRA